LRAALELDGTAAGVDRAIQSVQNNPNRWDFGTKPFASAGIRFAQTGTGPWELAPPSPIGFRYVEVTAMAAVPLYFAPFLGEPDSGSAVCFDCQTEDRRTASVRARSVAAQVSKSGFDMGVFPYSPFAHSNAGPDFGMTPGQVYTLRWPASPKVGNNLCAGDDQQAMLDLATANNGSERGYIEENSASVIRKAIQTSFQTRPLVIGEPVIMTNGAKQTERDAMIIRIGQDSDAQSATYSQYAQREQGNGRRIVVVPVNAGAPDSYRIRMFALFFLQPAGEYKQGGNNPWCAEYIGSSVEGAFHKAASPSGAFVVRLVQ
jgi:hypothetical protein